MALLETRGLSKRYLMGDIAVDALADVSLAIEPGEAVAIMGPSGSGKSTLMNLLGCLDVPTAGSYFLDGEDVSRLSRAELARFRNREIGFIFQTFNLLARATALENVELPLIYAGQSKSVRRKRAMEMLAAVGLADRAHHLPSQLSGGQQQRVAIARALGTAPKLVLADEPTGSLDSQSAQIVMRMLDIVNQHGITLLLITHDRMVASAMRRIVTLHDGHIVEDAATGMRLQ